MAEQVNNANDDSKYRVALDLTKWIVQQANDVKKESADDFLDLFLRCRKAVIGGMK